jgi:hypothetical protein
MLSRFDDFPIHQTLGPVTQPASTDRNFYDRYWFNGFDKGGELYFGAALGVYPNRQVLDASFSVLVGGTQHCFHVSRRAPAERAEIAAGPFTIEVVKPLREIRIRLEKNETGVECDLTFRARTIPFEEPRAALSDGGRIMLDTSRFVQFGKWQGTIGAGGTTIAIEADRVVGTRDRSWGIRPVGEPERGAPPTAEPGIFWVWSVNHFDDLCTFYETFEDHDGRTLLAYAAALPAYPSLDLIPERPDQRFSEIERGAVKIVWEPGTRRSRGATVELTARDGDTWLHELEPVLRFHLKGIGYQNPKWAHGAWKGELVVGGETFDPDELDPLAFENLHIQQVCRVRMGERTGVGAFEQLVIGSHRPSGFKSFLDGAPSPSE